MKKQKLRRLVIVLLALVFLGSGSIVLLQTYQQHLADRAYEEAARIALAASEAEAEESDAAVQKEQPQLPEPLKDPETVQLLENMDLNALQEVNGDVLGWIHIPDTAISYPLLRSADNNEYLRLTWDRQYSVAGSIFLEQKSSADLSDFHTLIYGHNMKNGSMFSQLHDYQAQAFFDDHPFVYIATNDAILQYEVFAAYTANVTSDTYRLYFEDDTRKQSAIDFYLEQSETTGTVVPTAEDQLLTLSTCTGRGNYDYRWVVQAVLTGRVPRSK